MKQQGSWAAWATAWAREQRENAPQHTLSNLPTEIQMAIMSHLPTRNLVKMQGVSRSLKNASKVVARNQFRQKVRAVKTAQTAVKNKAALRILLGIRTLLTKLQKNKWSVNVEIFHEFMFPTARYPILRVILRHAHDDELELLNSDYVMTIFCFGQRHREWSYRGRLASRLTENKATLAFSFEGNELKARLYDYSVFNGPGVSKIEFPWFPQAVQQAVEWYNQHPVRRNTTPKNNPNFLRPGKGAPFNVLRPARANTRTTQQKINNSRQHPAVLQNGAVS